MILETIIATALAASLGVSAAKTKALLGQPLVQLLEFPEGGPWPADRDAWQTPEGQDFLSAFSLMIKKPDQEGVLFTLSPVGLVSIVRTSVNTDPESGHIFGGLWVQAHPLQPTHPFEGAPLEGVDEEDLQMAELLLAREFVLAHHQTMMSSLSALPLRSDEGWFNDPLLLEVKSFPAFQRRVFPYGRCIPTQQILRRGPVSNDFRHVLNLVQTALKSVKTMDEGIMQSQSPGMGWPLLIIQEIARQGLPMTKESILKIGHGGQRSTYSATNTGKAYVRAGGPLFPLGHHLHPDGTP